MIINILHTVRALNDLLHEPSSWNSLGPEIRTLQTAQETLCLLDLHVLDNHVTAPLWGCLSMLDNCSHPSTHTWDSLQNQQCSRTTRVQSRTNISINKQAKCFYPHINISDVPLFHSSHSTVQLATLFLKTRQETVKYNLATDILSMKPNAPTFQTQFAIRNIQWLLSLKHFMLLSYMYTFWASFHLNFHRKCAIANANN